MRKKHMSIMTFIVGCGFLFSFLLTGYVFGAESSVEGRIKRLEQNMKSLEEANKALQHELTRAKDVQEIARLQAMYEAVHGSEEWLSWSLFADRPDTTKEVTMGKLVGFNAIKADYLSMAWGRGAKDYALAHGYTLSNEAPSDDLPTFGAISGGTPSGGGPPGGTSAAFTGVTMHPIGTPCIVVANDGKTAKATFTSLGFENGWCYGKYANSYIKIDGKWYIWHMKWLRCFKAPYSIGWADQTIDQIYEFTKGEKDADGNPKVNPEINYDYLLAPNKPFKTITVAKPYETWTKEDEDGGWWKRETKEP